MKYIFRKRRWQVLAGILDACGSVLCGWSRGHKALPKDPGAILVVRLDDMGDVVRASGIPQLVKGSYPSSKLYFLTNTHGAQLLDGNPYIDELIVFDPKWYRSSAKTAHGKGRSFFGTARYLRSLSIDVALLPRGDVRENWLTLKAGIPYRVGYGVTGGGFMLSRQARYREGVHEDEHTLDILRAVGIEARELKPKIYVSRPTQWTVTPRAVGIHLEAGTSAKQWSLEQKKEFIEECATAAPKSELFFVGQDKGFSDLLDGFLRAHAHLPWVNLIGKTSLDELKSVLMDMKFFVGFDSGPTHLASAMGLTTLFLYSGTNELQAWGPRLDTAEVLQNRVDCSPCHLAKCTVVGHPCLSGIRRTAVVDWIKERV